MMLHDYINICIDFIGCYIRKFSETSCKFSKSIEPLLYNYLDSCLMFLIILCYFYL